MQSMEPFNKISRILIEHNADPVLLNFERQVFGLPFNEILATNPRYIHYSRNKKRTITKGDILYRRYYNDLGDISQVQVLLPVQIKDTLLNSLHGEAGKHPGNFPIENAPCPQLGTALPNLRPNKRIDNSQITPELISILERDYVQ